MSYCGIQTLGWRIKSAACGFYFDPVFCMEDVVSGAVDREAQLPLLLKDGSRDKILLGLPSTDIQAPLKDF